MVEVSQMALLLLITSFFISKNLSYLHEVKSEDGCVDNAKLSVAATSNMDKVSYYNTAQNSHRDPIH